MQKSVKVFGKNSFDNAIRYAMFTPNGNKRKTEKSIYQGLDRRFYVTSSLNIMIQFNERHWSKI